MHKIDPIVLNICLFLSAVVVFFALDYFFRGREWYYWFAVGYTVLVLLGFIIINMINLYEHHEERKPKKEAQSDPNSGDVPCPVSSPKSMPTWSSRGEWAIPFSVRYAVSFEKDGKESKLGPWSPYYSSSQFSNPILSEFPVAGVDPDQIDKIKLYRQFEGHQPIAIDCLNYPYYGRYADRSGDDF